MEVSRSGWEGGGERWGLGAGGEHRGSSRCRRTELPVRKHRVSFRALGLYSLSPQLGFSCTSFFLGGDLTCVIDLLAKKKKR